MPGREFVNADRIGGFETASGVSSAQKKFAIYRRFDFARIAPLPKARNQIAPMGDR